MNQPIRAIETSYAGCRFRSRLEARWAVFFDHLDIPWDFEAQGFHTSAGGYLPDFYLPDADLYVEIKGPRPSDTELAKCQAIPNLVILVGSVPRQLGQMTFWQYGPCQRSFHLFHVCDDGWTSYSAADTWPFPPVADKARVDEALTAARSARFEHGQSGSGPRP